jgi:protein-L-isoaspartate(D-aspartate) O-methyltransferase
METERQRHVTNLLRELNQLGVRNRRVLTALATVPREAFVPEHLRGQAWENRALPIGEEQTISQPLIVALMTQALQLHGDEKVLEIGTGSGYQAAVLAELARSVVTVERYSVLAERARTVLSNLNYDNVKIVVGDGTLGWPADAPYDRIIVTAAAPHLPGPLHEQLSDSRDARIVIPIGTARDQDLIVFERDGDRLREINLGPVRFVPLIGEFGWQQTS